MSDKEDEPTPGDTTCGSRCTKAESTRGSRYASDGAVHGRDSTADRSRYAQRPRSPVCVEVRAGHHEEGTKRDVFGLPL